MLRMRLKPVGRKHDRSYRIVIQQKRQSPQSGRYVERIGEYDPRSDEVALDVNRAEYWLGEGVQPTETVHNILVEEGILDADKINPLPQKSPVVNETEEADEDAEVEDEETESDEEDEPTPEDTDEEDTETQSDDAEEDTEDTTEDEETNTDESAEKEESDEKDGEDDEEEESAESDQDDGDENDDEEEEEK